MNKGTAKVLAVMIVLYLIMNRLIGLWTGGMSLPNLSGMKEQEILSWSEESGIPVEFEYTYIASAEEGICISTYPDAGAVVNKEDTVIAYINQK